MKKSFGIVSWLPNEEPDRTERQDRLNRLFKQLNDIWPNIDILIITQNWKTFKPIDISNKIVRVDFKEGLGILKARQTLREEFLKSKYEYLIMMDDDCIIKTTEEAAKQYIEELDRHPQGFCFINSKFKGCDYKYNPYIAAQLNLCAISKFIYEKEPMVPLDPQKDEAYEDLTFATLLHHKYSKYEFIPPKDIIPIQFQNKEENAPSTWCQKDKINLSIIHTNSYRICDYIVRYKDLPKNLDDYIVRVEKQPENKADGKKNCYLYF